MIHSSSTALIALSVFLMAGCLMGSTTRKEATGEVTGRVFSKSDVETRKDRPIQVLVAVISPARLDSLLRKLDAPEAPRGEIINLGRTVQGNFETYATGYDVSGENGRYRIQVNESGTHFLCVTGETKVPEKKSWSIVGCMKVEVSEGDTVEQDLYMQFGSLVSPR